MVNWTGRAADPMSCSLPSDSPILPLAIDLGTVDRPTLLQERDKIERASFFRRDTSGILFRVLRGGKKYRCQIKAQGYFIIQDGTLSSTIIEIDFLSICMLLRTLTDNATDTRKYWHAGRNVKEIPLLFYSAVLLCPPFDARIIKYIHILAKFISQVSISRNKGDAAYISLFLPTPQLIPSFLHFLALKKFKIMLNLRT